MCLFECVFKCVCMLDMCYLARSCFNKVLGQLQGCLSILSGIMTLLLFSLYLLSGIQAENLTISRSGCETQRDTEEEREEEEGHNSLQQRLSQDLEFKLLSKVSPVQQ